MEKAKRLLDEIRQVTVDIFGANLVGIYVHGSYAFGCFHWEISDLDLLVVAARPMTQTEKIRYISAILTLSKKAPPKGLEMSVVLAEHCAAFVHPTPYDLHFSGAHLASARRDIDTYCKTMQGVDPDLAAHFAVTRAVGIPLFGKPIGDVFAPVPRADYLDSIRYDVKNAVEDIGKNPIYVTLNLCRAAAYVKDGAILSKADGGRWGLKNLPDKYHGIMTTALQGYTSGRPDPTDMRQGEQTAFAAYMLGQIL